MPRRAWAISRITGGRRSSSIVRILGRITRRTIPGWPIVLNRLTRNRARPAAEYEKSHPRAMAASMSSTMTRGAIARM